MAFEISAGHYSSPNDLIDALAAAWEFDSTDLESENHSVTWGELTLTQEGGTSIYLYRSGSRVDRETSLSSGSYTIVRSTGAVMLVYVYNSRVHSFVFTTGSHVADSGAGAKMAAWFNGTSYVNVADEVSVKSYKFDSFFEISPSAVQVVPHLQADGFAADNLYVMRMNDTASDQTNRMQEISGTNYYIGGGFAIKEE